MERDFPSLIVETREHGKFLSAYVPQIPSTYQYAFKAVENAHEKGLIDDLEQRKWNFMLKTHKRIYESGRQPITLEQANKIFKGLLRANPS